MSEADDISTVESPEEGPIAPRPRPPDDSEVDITPMIDCTFLLLIFFMVASHIGETPPVELPPARHGVAVLRSSSTYFTLSADHQRQASIYHGELPDPAHEIRGSLEQQEEQVLKLVKEGLAGSPRKNLVVINAAKHVRHRDVNRVAQAASKAGEIKLYYTVMEED